MNLRLHLLVVGVDSPAHVLAGVFLPQVLDEEHDGRVAGLLLGVNPTKEGGECRYSYSNWMITDPCPDYTTRSSGLIFHSGSYNRRVPEHFNLFNRWGLGNSSLTPHMAKLTLY